MRVRAGPFGAEHCAQNIPAGGQVLKLPATPLLWAGYIAVGVP